MRKFLSILTIVIVYACGLSAQTTEPYTGTWSPDDGCALGEIKIKSTGGNNYKVRLEDGRVLTGTKSNNTITASYENEPVAYGSFWVTSTGDIHYRIDREEGTYGSVTGYYDGTGNQRSYGRSEAATEQRSYFRIKLVFNNDEMTVSYKLSTDFIKHGQKLFYQESNWVHLGTYSQW